MSIDQVRLRTVRVRWQESRKIHAGDVDWLLDIAKRQSMKESADSINRGPMGGLGDLFDQMFGGSKH